MPLSITLVRLTAALLIGSAIGIDREIRHKPAGMRTHALVTLGAAALTLISIQMAAPGDSGGVLRVVQGIITGVGFLGAGVILHPAHEEVVLGLTTAASLWVVAGLGIGCGAGEWGPTLSASALALLILVFGGRIEAIVNRLAGPEAKPGEGRVDQR